MYEPILAAGKREVMEETGDTVSNLKHIGVVRELQDTYTFIHFGLVAESFTGEIQNIEPDKCKGWEWFSFETLPNNILPGHKAVIDLFQSKNTTVIDLI